MQTGGCRHESRGEMPCAGPRYCEVIFRISSTQQRGDLNFGIRDQIDGLHPQLRLKI